MTTHNEDRTAGVIATLTDGYVLHAGGSRRDAMRAVAEVCDTRGVKIRTISTAQTIETDLLGHREKKGGGEHDTYHVEVPEANYCGLIGRRDLYVPPRSPWAA